MICSTCWQESASDERCDACGTNPLLGGRYRLLRKLGQGAAGITFAGVRASDDLAVCVKALFYRDLANFDAERNVQREAAILRSLRHPQIPAYIDDFTAGVGPSSALYLVQELVTGENLDDEVKHHRPTLAGIVAILDELLGIVAHLHDLRPAIVHRDIKPQNIMRRSEDGRLVLIDFGSVKEVTHASLDARLSLQGTLGYMAPEQLRGEATPRSDLYAIGMVGVSLLLGRLPDVILGAPSGADATAASSSQGLSLNVPAPLEAWFAQITAWDPAARFQDAAAAQRALALAARPPSEPASPPSLTRSTLFPSLLPASSLEAVSPRVPAPPPSPADCVYLGDDEDEDDHSLSDSPGDEKKVAFWVSAVVCVMAGLGALWLVSAQSKKPTIFTQKIITGPGAIVSSATSSCSGACRAPSVPFKEGLRFGMSMSEARAARAGLAAGPAPVTFSELLPFDLGNRHCPVREPPVQRLRIASLLMNERAVCDFDFTDALGLVRLACTTTSGFSDSQLLTMLDQVASLYGVPSSSPTQNRAYGLGSLEPAVWEARDGYLKASYDWWTPPRAPGDPVTLPSSSPQDKRSTFTLTQRSSAWSAVLQEAARQADSAAAEEERRRINGVADELKSFQEEIQRLQKKGLPPDRL